MFICLENVAGNSIFCDFELNEGERGGSIGSSPCISVGTDFP